jgi:hypothetical protein
VVVVILVGSLAGIGDYLEYHLPLAAVAAVPTTVAAAEQLAHPLPAAVRLVA